MDNRPAHPADERCGSLSGENARPHYLAAHADGTVEWQAAGRFFARRDQCADRRNLAFNSGVCHGRDGVSAAAADHPRTDQARDAQMAGTAIAKRQLDLLQEMVSEASFRKFFLQKAL